MMTQHSCCSLRARIGRRLLPALGTVLLASAAHGGVAYTITDLGTFGGSKSYGMAINASGQVTGYFRAANGSYHTFLYDPGASGSGKYKDLGVASSGGWSWGYAISDGGQIAGDSMSSSGLFHAAGYGPNISTSLTDLGSLATGTASYGRGINSAGQITGYAANASGDTHAFLYDPNSVGGNRMKDLGTLPGGTMSGGYGINGNGEVTGYSNFVSGSPTKHAVVFYSDGRVIDLGTPVGDTDSRGYAINNTGMVAGESFNNNPSTGTIYHAFLYDPNSTQENKMQALGALVAGGESRAWGLNSAGVVVGEADTADDVHAFIYCNDAEGMVDLNTLIDPTSGWTLYSAHGINDCGQIVGSGSVDGVYHAFVLTPVPEPGAMGLLLAGAMGIGLRRRQRTA